MKVKKQYSVPMNKNLEWLGRALQEGVERAGTIEHIPSALARVMRPLANEKDDHGNPVITNATGDVRLSTFVAFTDGTRLALLHRESVEQVIKNPGLDALGSVGANISSTPFKVPKGALGQRVQVFRLLDRIAIEELDDGSTVQMAGALVVPDGGSLSAFEVDPRWEVFDAPPEGYELTAKAEAAVKGLWRRA